jgi:hypothetical protein
LFSSPINTSTPTITRRSINNRNFPVIHPKEESNKKKVPIAKRKHSISPIPHTPIPIKKRTKTDSSMNKSHMKRKESKPEVEESDHEEDNDKPIIGKRKLNLDLSSK